MALGRHPACRREPLVVALGDQRLSTWRASTTWRLDGSDADPASDGDPPFATLAVALAQLARRRHALVRGGDYHEALRDLPLASRAQPPAQVPVRAYPGERPVMAGLLWLTNADYWTLTG